MSQDKSTEPQEPEAGTARPGLLESFQQIAAKAREVLRERGFSEAQIEAELQRSKRLSLDD